MKGEDRDWSWNVLPAEDWPAFKAAHPKLAKRAIKAFSVPNDAYAE